MDRVIPRSIHIYSFWPGGYDMLYGWSIACAGETLYYSQRMFRTPEKARAAAIAQFDNIVNFYTICKCGVSKSLPESRR